MEDAKLRVGADPAKEIEAATVGKPEVNDKDRGKRVDSTVSERPLAIEVLPGGGDIEGDVNRIE